MRAQLMSLAKGGLYGFLTVLVVGFAVTVAIGVLVALTHTASVRLAVGPIPLMSAWSDSSGGFGFQTEWGLGTLACVGAAVGAALAWRAQRQGNAAAS